MLIATYSLLISCLTVTLYHDGLAPLLIPSMVEMLFLLLSTPVRQVMPSRTGWSEEPIYQLEHGNPEEEVA